MAQAQDNPAGARCSRRPTQRAERRRQPAAGDSFTREELEKLLAPIALYPDPLLAQMLPASAYPVQIVQAQRWLDKNKALVAKNDYSGIDNQNWDPAVKALARFPDVIKTDERGPRLDDGPRRRRSEPAPGRRRSHPGASRQGGSGRDA